jgi:hypothetical protein
VNNEGRSWFAVRCIFQWPEDEAYEERITLWHASSFDAAVALAEDEANDYAQERDFAYLGLAQAYKLDPAKVGHGTEVFSLLRDSDLRPDDYLSTYFDTGAERQGTL